MAGYAEASAQTETKEELPRFADLAELSSEGKKAMESFGYERMTPVQTRSFHPILAGKELLARAKTGSGKTLSFLLPAIERIHRLLEGQLQPGARYRARVAGGELATPPAPSGEKSRKTSNLGAACRKGAVAMLVLTPVRELSMQVAKEAEKLTSFYQSCRMVCMTGGVPWEEDLQSLNDAGTSTVLLIATPGRLQSHVAKTESFAARLRAVQILVLDEVDQLASDVFRPATLDIVKALPAASQRQGLFYSATLSDDVTALVKAIGREEYTFVDVIQSDDHAPEHIDQQYTVVPTERMTESLWRFTQGNAGPDFKAVAIFMTGRIAAYYADAFRKAGTTLAVFEIHARRSQKQRTEESEKFRAASSGILFTSDVSSRGLDYPGVTHVVQMGAAHSRAEYIHRLGRTGRAGAKGQGLLLLHEFERDFLEQLTDLTLTELPLETGEPKDMPNFQQMPIAKNVKAQAYYSRINHVMRNSPDVPLLDVMREAHRFARSIGATDEEGRPPEITLENATKMGVAEIADPSVHLVAAKSS